MEDEPHENEVVLVVLTCPDVTLAGTIGTTLVVEKLAACVNRVPGIESTYVWEGRVQTDAEVLLLAKTTRGRLAALTARVHALHPYELPEVIALPVCGGSERYLDWVRQSVGPLE